MLTESQLMKYAEVLFWGLTTAKKTPFRKGDIILIQYEPSALKLTEVLFASVLEKGMHPIQRMGLTWRMERSFFQKASENQLTFIPPGERLLYQSIQGRIFLRAPESLTHLRDVDPKKIGTVLVSRKPLRQILDRREAQGSYSWTLCSLPTPAPAQQAGLTLEEYTRQIVRACYLDKKDPVAEWERIHREVGQIKQWLNRMAVKYFRIESENMDLRITPGEHRRWKGISGHNLPSFEIFLSPDWRGTEGTYYANLPSFRTGNLVDQVRLTFRRGKVVEVTAQRGEGFIQKQIQMDPGACRVGEFSLTDRRFSRIDRFMADTLFDENFGGRFGNCHLALGASYADTFDGDPAELTRSKKIRLGFNDSALHWDLVNTERKTVTACFKNGKSKVIYENGCFRY